MPYKYRISSEETSDIYSLMRLIRTYYRGIVVARKNIERPILEFSAVETDRQPIGLTETEMNAPETKSKRAKISVSLRRRWMDIREYSEQLVLARAR